MPSALCVSWMGEDRLLTGLAHQWSNTSFYIVFFFFTVQMNLCYFPQWQADSGSSSTVFTKGFQSTLLYVQSALNLLFIFPIMTVEIKTPSTKCHSWGRPSDSPSSRYLNLTLTYEEESIRLKGAFEENGKQLWLIKIVLHIFTKPKHGKNMQKEKFVYDQKQIEQNGKTLSHFSNLEPICKQTELIMLSFASCGTQSGPLRCVPTATCCWPFRVNSAHCILGWALSCWDKNQTQATSCKNQAPHPSTVMKTSQQMEPERHWESVRWLITRLCGPSLLFVSNTLSEDNSVALSFRKCSGPRIENKYMQLELGADPNRSPAVRRIGYFFVAVSQAGCKMSSSKRLV